MNNERKISAIEWRDALEALNDGLWEIDVEAGTLWLSDKWYKVFGYTKDEVGSMEEWLAHIHPEDLRIAAAHFERLQKGEISNYSIVLRYKKENGYRWAISKAVIVERDELGNATKVVGTHTDITEQKNSEQALVEGEKKYKALFDYSAAMICTHDLNGILTSVNPFCLELLGYTEDEIVGKPLSDLIIERFRQNFSLQYLAEIKQKGKASGIMHVTKKDGQVAYLLYHNYLFKQSEETQYVIGFGQDFTDRVMAEEALRHSMETFSSAFVNSASGIGLVTPEGRWLDVNPALCEMTEYSRQELLNMSFQDITHVDDLETDLILVKRMVSKEINTYSLEKRYITKSGKVIWVLLTVSLVWKTDGTPDFFISQIIDVTKSKKLRDEVDKKNIELEATRISLENKIKQLEELSHIIAHNLRGPAANIKFLADILKASTGKPSDNPEENAMADIMPPDQAIDFIHDASASLMNTLESVLMIARISLNKEMPYDNCDVEEVVNDIISQLHGLMIEKQAIIDLKLDVKKISYPKVYLESILYNLINNALKYSDPEKQVNIVISTMQVDQKIKLSVKDNGLGINLRQYGHKIFKLNQVFHDNKDSRGVGLFLIKTQIESLGGSITVQSEEKIGSEFTVTF